LRGAIEDLEQRLGVLFVSLVARRPGIGWMPVLPALEVLRSDAKKVAGREAFDTAKQRFGSIEMEAREPGGDVRLLKPVVERQRKQTLRHGSQREELFSAVKKERAVAGMVAGGEEFLASGRPYSEREGSQEAVQAGRSPLQPCGQQDSRIRMLLRVSDIQVASQVGSIIQPDVRHQTDRVVMAPERLIVKTIFGKGLRKSTSESDPPVAPKELLILAIPANRRERGAR
jgi:hypothetical protein